MIRNLSQNIYLQVLIVFLVACFTFLPTAQNFFYLDEYGNLYDFSHNDIRGINVFTAHTFASFFHLFGTNPTGYFTAGIFIFALSVILFYFFVSMLFNNKILGFISALIYASAPVGIDTTTMIWTYIMEGGYPLTIALISLLFLLLLYFQKGKIVFFLLALLGFFIFLELEPRRVFLFLPIIILFDYLMHFRKTSIPDFKFFLRVLPFVCLFVAYYKYNITLSGFLETGIINPVEIGGFDWQTKVDVALNGLFDIRPIVTLANILLGSFLVFPKEILSLTAVKFTNFWAIVVMFFAITTIILGWRIKMGYGLILLFALFWIYINIFGIFVFSSPGISETTHRTLSLAAPGYGLFIALGGHVWYSTFKKRYGKISKKLDRIFITLFILFLTVSILATRSHFEKFNNFRSYAAHAFFKDLKNFYPSFPVNSLIYIETPTNPQINYQLSRIYGGNNYGPGATFAIFYPELKKEEINVVRELKDVKKFIASDSAKINNVYAFYFDENGLKDQTQKIRSKLKE